MFIDSNHAFSHLRWMENLVKHQKVLKYYENECRLWVKEFLLSNDTNDSST